METLPPEIVENILEYLDVKDVLSFSEVCPQWNQALYRVNDMFWKKVVETHSLTYRAIRRKSSLTWFELFRSLSMWQQVATADVTVNKIQTKHKTDSFQIVSGSVISCLRISESKDQHKSTTKITYYDLETLEKIGNKCFDFTLRFYEENENFFVITYLNNDRLVIDILVKSSNKHFTFEEPSDVFVSPVLLANQAYYLIEDKFCRVKLYETANEVGMGTFFDVSEVDCDTGEIVEQAQLCYRGIEDLSHMKPLSITQVNDRFKARKNFVYTRTRLMLGYDRYKQSGFHWEKNILTKLLSPDYMSNFFLSCSAIHIQDKVVIVGMKSPYAVIKIYYDPVWDKKRYLDGQSPSKAVDLTPYLGEGGKDRDRHVRQIDVSEILNGHKIFLLVCGSIYIIKLTHSASHQRYSKKPWSLFKNFCNRWSK